jgi:amidase
VAVLLEVMAGPGGASDVVAGLDGGIDGLRIGLVDEGFGRPGSDPAVDEAVRAAAATLGARGARVMRVAIPWHADGEDVWGGIALEGVVDGLLRGNGVPTNVDADVDLRLVEALRRGRVERADLLSEPVKLVLLAGEYLRRQQGGAAYARARRLVAALRGAYDDALARFDVLVMPTTPTTAPPLPSPDAGIEERVAAAFGPLHGNTCPLNATGHPAISIPCGLVGGLPVGMMAVAAAGADALLLRLARACEVHGISALASPRASPA